MMCRFLRCPVLASVLLLLVIASVPPAVAQAREGVPVSS